VITEAHLDQERLDGLHRIHGKRLKIFHSEYPITRNGRGVAVVLNRALTTVDPGDINIVEIVPGRAILINTVWYESERLSALGVYAPNEPANNRNFWEDIHAFFASPDNQHHRKPDLILGDCNVVEEAVDRYPRPNEEQQARWQGAVDALDSLKLFLGLSDGWRDAYPHSIRYTFSNHDNSYQSRIDRIYIKNALLETAYEWDIKPSGILTDHQMVSVRVSAANAPEIGKGRWALPLHLLKDKRFMLHCNNKGIELESQLRTMDPGHRDANNNPQTLWRQYKDGLVRFAREREKAVGPRLDKEIKNLEVAYDAIANDPLLSDDERAASQAIYLQRLTELTQIRHRNTRESVRARNTLEAETISRYWSKTNRALKPRDIIYRLQTDGATEEQPSYETSSPRMAEIARDYHEKLQQPEVARDATEREAHIAEIAGKVNKKLNDDDHDRAELDRPTSETDLRTSLKLSPHFSAPGVDGIPFELWKTLSNRYDSGLKEQATSGKDPPFNVVSVLTTLCNDIELHGVQTDTGFAESWMCPIYKKNDRSKIANYRPISLLNTDYKTFTKSLTIRLAPILPKLIHVNQAGFIQGRHIYDHIWLSKFVIDLAQETDRDGAIVALDQEKAYDKIEHDYLWRS
jgi:exonuclease III